MDKSNKPADKLASLRKKAEKKLKTQLERLKELSAKGAHELAQELGTHQIELEMQNEELRRALEGLEASRSKYSDLYDFAPVGYFTFDAAGVVREANLAAAKMLGVERLYLLNKPFASFLSKDDKDAFRLHCAAILDNRTKQTIEVRLKHRDKTEFFALLESIAVEDPEGNPVAVRTAASDITERRRAEETLQKSELRYRSLFENMLDGYAYCRMLYDDRGRPADFIYLSVNSAFERLTGLKNVVGMKVTDVIPGIRESHPELLEAYGRVAATGKTEKFEIEFKPLGMWLSISVYSMERDHFTAVFDNITERKLAEEALRQSEKRLGFFVQYAPAALAMFDRDMRYVSVSNRWLSDYGFGNRDLRGLSIYEVSPGLPEHWKEFHRRGLAGEVLRAECERYERADGVVQWLRWELRPWCEISGTVGGIVIFTEDITARIKAEEELKQRSEELEIARAAAEKERLLLAAVMEALPVGVVITDALGGKIRSNREYELVWGGATPPARSVDDYAAYQAWWPDTGKAVQPGEWASAIAVQKGEPVTGQVMRIRKFDGSDAYVINSACPVRDSDGKIIGCAVAIQDITTLKDAEETIRRHMEVLAERNQELMRFNEAAVGRELRMIELKQEINKACAESGKPPRYRVDFDEDQDT